MKKIIFGCLIVAFIVVGCARSEKVDTEANAREALKAAEIEYGVETPD